MNKKYLMDRTKSQISEGIVSVVVNTILFGLKFFAGTVTGSIALIADAWHTLSDSISSVVVVLSGKLSTMRADKEHPFGHGRLEYISSIFIAVILGIISYEFLKNSIVRFSSKEGVEYGLLAIVVTITSIIVKELLAQYAFFLGRQTNSSILKADGWHHRSDALSSVVVLIGIFFAKKYWWIDSVLGIIIALMLFYATFTILLEAITKILGEEPDKDLIEKIIKVVDKLYDNSFELHHFHLHDYVLHKEITFHIRLDKDKTIEEGHTIATVIENAIKEQLHIEATIHIEPQR